jgi:hypothetical protein
MYNDSDFNDKTEIADIRSLCIIKHLSKFYRLSRINYNIYILIC